MRKVGFVISLGLMLPLGALAEADAAGAALTPYTWESLATVGGATSATLLIVQYVKAPLDRWFHIPTRLVVLAIALLLMAAAKAYTTGLSWQDVPLIVINAFVVALAAMGAYEISFANVDEKRARTAPPK